jgi:hypothetical protein
VSEDVGCNKSKLNNIYEHHLSKMPYVYFGFKPRNRGTTKLAVRTSSGEFEPAKPSDVKVFSQTTFIPIWSILSTILGLVVAILSFPKFSYAPTSVSGLMTRAAPANLPFKTPGLAIVLKKGASLSIDESTELETRGFSSMQFSGRTLWLKEIGSKDDFTYADSLTSVDPLGPCPARYLNTHSFRAFLTLRSFTTRVCELFDLLTQTSSQLNTGLQSENSIPDTDGWLNVALEETRTDVEMSSIEFKFKKAAYFKTDAGSEKTVRSFMHLPGSADGTSSVNSGVVFNSFNEPQTGFLRPQNLSSIKSPGLIFKFNHQLALPDPNLVGDIIGRYFLAGLGDSYDDQVENLELLKSGLSGLRLTRLGDELTHLYKCIEVAIESNTGCVPIFSNETYEGCILAGGSTTRQFIIHGAIIPVLSVSDLRDEMLSVSDHTAAIRYISTLFPADDQSNVQMSQSFHELRNHCLTLNVTQDIRDEVIRKAALLDFGVNQWVVNPANLKRCFDLICNFSSLCSQFPVGRLSLFSKDPVLVAMSCFGEKSCPSWDIPNGTSCSLVKSNPPNPPPQVSERRSGSRGEISDAAWVMVIRQTDLFSAVEEFKRMASTLTYRSTSSVLAKRVGHRVFSRDRMAEFWGVMRESLRVVNPLAAFEQQEGKLKRGATESAEAEKGVVGASKKRRMEF